MAQNSLLWLLKFDDYGSTRKSKLNRYIPQKGYDFSSKFQQFAAVKNMKLIYCGSNGPYIMNAAYKTGLPIFDWDMTIVTTNNNNNMISSQQLKQSKEFIALKQEFGISKVYNVSYRIDESFTAKTETPKTLKIPKRPYSSFSYEWLSNTPKGVSDRIIKLCKIQNQPIMMLNLMQIVNKKQDQIYVSKVMPLLYGVGGRPGIMGETNDYWTQVALVYYPNTKAFWEMATSYYYVGKGLFSYKHKSTKDVFVVATIPLYCDQRYARNNVPSKL